MNNTFLRFAALAFVAATIANTIALKQLYSRELNRDTKWYNGEILISVNINGTNHTAKLNNIELGLREDGVVAFRTNATLQPVRAQQP